MANILSGANFGVGFPQGGGVANNEFSTRLASQLIGMELKNQREDQLNQQKAEQVQLATSEKTRLNGMFAELERIRNMPDGASKRTELARFGKAEIDAGRDGSEFIEALNADTPTQLNLNISRLSTKAGTIAGQLDEVLKANAPIEAKTATGKAREDLEAGLITQPEFIAETAAKGTGPLTSVGKARADLKAGRITKEDFKAFQSAPKEFKTDIGKTIADKQLAIELFGADSPQVKAFQAAIDSDAKGEGPKLSDVAGVRKEFTKQSGDFIDMRNSFNKIQSASDSGPGDVSLIFGFMKLIDPGSTVREGEFATAEETAGIPTRITNLYNKALEGDRLGQQQRDGFKKEAKNLFDAQLQTQRQLENVFRGLASRGGMNPDDVVIDFVGEIPETKQKLRFDALGNQIQ